MKQAYGKLLFKLNKSENWNNLQMLFCLLKQFKSDPFQMRNTHLLLDLFEI